MTNRASNLWKDSYLAYVPLLGAALALTFDVGYFFALNLSFFTLFSLSEHILFAIQSFPITLAVLLLCLIFAGIFLNVPFHRNNPPTEPRRLHGLQLIIAFIVLALLVLALLGFLFYLMYSTPITIPLLIELFIGLGGWVFIDDPYKRAFTAAITVLFLLTFSFFIGYLFAASATTTADQRGFFQFGVGTINLESGAQINGRIIRSGERGLLIYDPVSAELRFLSWKGINSIEAPRRPPG
jgi:hypothetical protein